MIAFRAFSPETAAISTEPSSSTLISVLVSSWILRIIEPPLPMMSRMRSGLTLMVVMRGAKSLIWPRVSGITSSILSRMNRRARSACARPCRMIASLMPLTLMSIWSAVIPSRVPVTLKSMSPNASSLPRMSVRTAKRPSGSLMRPIAAPATGALIGTPASMSASVEPHVDAIDVDPFDVTDSDTSRMTYGKSSWLGRTGRRARSARLPCPISRRPGPRIGLFSPVEYGGML